MTAPSAQEVQQARAYLQGRGGPASHISPRHFAGAAKEMGKGYGQTLKYLVLLMSGGSGVGPSRIATADQDRTDPITALGDNTPSRQMEYDNVPAG